MKKTMILAWVQLAILLLFGVLCAVLSERIFPALFFLAAAVLQGVFLFFLHKDRKMLLFLVEEKRRKNGKAAVLWDEEEEKRLQLAKKRVELYALQSQINPHFLYNTLDSIRARALIDGQTQIAEMTEILAKFFRYCIGQTESLVKIREEIDHIRDYYYIQKFRFEDRFEMEIFAENEEIYEYFIPKMTLQPLVENAMAHGLEKVNRKGKLQIRLMMTERKIVILVSDNGAGMNMEQLDRLNERMEQMYYQGSRKDGHNSIAVTNVNARIKLTFGQDYGIHYRSMQQEGTDAVVTIPKVDDFVRNRYEVEWESQP